LKVEYINYLIKGEYMEITKEKIIKEAKSISLIVIVVFAFRSVFFEPYRIPSGSMIPTLNIGDLILVNKFSYGFKLPFSDMYWNPIYLGQFTPPKRGDVVVFKYPKSPDINYVKRVIGLPGDTVEMRKKIVYINGKEVQKTTISGKEFSENMVEKYKKVNFNFYNAKTGNQTHPVLHTKEEIPADNLPSFKVPKGQFFVMGDNRDFSADSRYWGFVPQENIKGKALLIWFSITNPFSEHSFMFRPKRIGTFI
jgi:signal peptidase I